MTFTDVCQTVGFLLICWRFWSQDRLDRSILDWMKKVNALDCAFIERMQAIDERVDAVERLVLDVYPAARAHDEVGGESGE